MPSAPALQVDIVSPQDEPHWDETVAQFPGACAFHSAGWARVLCETYRFRPAYFVARNTQRAIACIVPLIEVNSWLTGRRGISLPFTDECTPLGTDEHALRRVTEAIVARGAQRRWKHWELRGGVEALGAPTAVAYQGHRLALCSDPARLFARCDSAVRRAVRKAEQARLTISFAHDAETVRAFHGLVCKTRQRQGLPPQPLRFFENIQRHLLARGQGCVVLARQGDTPIAGAMFLHFAGSALFKFGASDAAFQQLRPNNLVMWHAIDWHARAGFASLDFGRTSLDNEGLRRFKLGWGATERLVRYTRFDCRTAAFVQTRDRSSGWHNRVFKFLPSAVARVLGAAAYKHVA